MNIEVKKDLFKESDAARRQKEINEALSHFGTVSARVAQIMEDDTIPATDKSAYVTA